MLQKSYPSLIQLFAAVLMFNSSLLAQNQEAIDYIRSHSDLDRLNQMALEFKLRDSLDLEQAYDLAAENGWPTEFMRPDSSMAYLVRVLNGRPLYRSTTNVNAAISTQTNELHPGGSSGLNLEGDGITIGEWDGGKVRETHEQFSGRASQADGHTNLSDHATHVAGTMVGDGTGSSSAKGMAPKADLDAYYWDNDDSEMASAAAAGLLISNHSYGFVSGWSGTEWWGDTTIDYKEDPAFGVYYYADDWDDIAMAAPYYLIVKSAGNDRNDAPPANGVNYQYGSSSTNFTYDSTDPTRSPEQDGGSDGYDCIGWYGNAKNILTVGAVNDVTSYTGASSVTMSSFSGWGPTDDGRIKPDIVGNGVGLYSSLSGSDSQYGSYSGTSMSAPNVTGSLALLHEHYLATHNNIPMLSSTMKALVIHTARECGSAPGPDYIYGWGLLSAEDAAELISQDTNNTNIISEATLSNGGSATHTFIANGTDPLKITICYTEPSASREYNLNSSTLRLVHDLDISLTDGSNTYQPYVLDPANPSNAATTGDNDRDNVEHIYLASPIQGQQYTLTINHEGSLTQDQDYSLIISGIAGSFYTVPACTSGCDISSTANWNSETDGSGFAPTNFTDPDHFVVQSGHSTSLSADLEFGNSAVVLEVETGALVTVSSGMALSIAGGINNEGTISVENSGSLIQTNNSDLNEGSGIYQVTRNTGNLADHNRFQYWSSPVDTATMAYVFSGANSNDFYHHSDGSMGWQNQSATAVMTPGLGYATTPTVNAAASNFNEDRTLTGTINNATITTSVSASSGEFVLVGNPYPGPIDGEDFLNNNTNLAGALYFWNHSTNVSAYNGAGSNDAQDYAIWNLLGSTSGNNNEAPDDYIQSCQGFFVEASSAISSISFSNSLRVNADNSQFFRVNSLNRERVWLSLRLDTSLYNQILVGFSTNATDAYDRLYDATKFVGNSQLGFYSVLNNQALGIQGLDTLSGDTTVVELGAFMEQGGDYTITLDSIDNLDPSYVVYLEDRSLGIIQNMELQNTYSFNLSAADSLVERFFLNFVPKDISVEENTSINKYSIYQQSAYLKIEGLDEHKNYSILLRNLSGKLIAKWKQNTEGSKYPIGNLPNGIYLVSIKAKDEFETQKVYLKN